jgi:hypothetical protein
MAQGPLPASAKPPPPLPLLPPPLLLLLLLDPLHVVGATSFHCPPSHSNAS